MKRTLPLVVAILAAPALAPLGGADDSAALGKAPFLVGDTLRSAEDTLPYLPLAYLPREVMQEVATPTVSTVPREDPYHILNSVKVSADGSTGRLTQSRIPAHHFTTVPRDPTPKPVEPVPTHPGKIHPDLQAPRPPTAPVDVLIVVRDAQPMPRLPDLPIGVERGAPGAAPYEEEQAALIEQVRARREASQDDFVRRLVRGGVRAELLEHFWVTNAFRAAVLWGDLATIAALGDTVYVEPTMLGTIHPQHDGDWPNEMEMSRSSTRLNSNWYYHNTPASGAYIGLLDTGVRATHALLSSPDRVDIVADCTGPPGTGCPLSDPDTDCWDHGTATASVLSANKNFGQAHRGMTKFMVDSWNVYDYDSYFKDCFLDGAAVLRGFQAALQAWDRVLVAEMQAMEPEDGAIASAADNAFDAGALVIAANGNCAADSACLEGGTTVSMGTVRSPAIAHKAIGVGAYRLHTDFTPSYQSLGPATDGRFKPDLQAPTDVRAASVASDTAMEYFGGTSASTPHAAGAAALLRQWMKSFGTFDPGQTYAFLHVGGTEPTDGTGPWWLHNEEGSGDLRLPPCGLFSWFKTSIAADGSAVNVPVVVFPASWDFDLTRRIEAAIWWPEKPGEEHDDLDVRIYDPSGAERARAESVHSVFELARVDSGVAPGLWTLQVRGYYVPTGPQTVYGAVHVNGC